jgi:hypothetical protein
MSTRSAIIEEVKGGYRGIYCHSDGYLAYNGDMLHKHYSDPAKVHALIDLGDISSLNEYVEPMSMEHCFDAPEDDVVVAYHRDRQEDWESVHPTKGKTITNIAKRLAHNGHVYLFADNVWMYSTDGESFELLKEALARDVKPEPKEYNCIHCDKPIYPTYYIGDRDWKHKKTDEYSASWTCCDNMECAQAPDEAIWTEPSKKEDGAE